MKPAQYSQPRGLWWTALVTLVLGGTLAFVISRSSPMDPNTGNTARLVIAATVLIAGLCIIAATARWWMKR